MMPFALSSIFLRILRCDSESLGVGRLPLRAASSANNLASSPHNSGEVFIVIAIFTDFKYKDIKYNAIMQLFAHILSIGEVDAEADLEAAGVEGVVGHREVFF